MQSPAPEGGGGAGTGSTDHFAAADNGGHGEGRAPQPAIDPDPVRHKCCEGVTDLEKSLICVAVRARLYSCTMPAFTV